MLQRYNFLPIQERIFIHLRKKTYLCSRFERGLHKCYSLDNEETVFIRHDVSDVAIDAGTEN